MDIVGIILLIVKISAIVFALLHFFAILIVLRQVMLAINTVKTRGSNTIKLVLITHVIFLLLVLLTVIILPIR